MGTVSLLITMGPIEKSVTFHVLDIKASFNFLLPWIHDLRAVPSSSSLHQKVKLIVGGKKNLSLWMLLSVSPALDFLMIFMLLSDFSLLFKLNLGLLLFFPVSYDLIQL